MRIAILDLYPRGKGPRGPSVSEAVMAVQRQIDEHFAPIWGCRAALSLRRTPDLSTGCFAGDLPDVDGIVYISPKFSPAKEPALKGRKVDRASAFHFKQHGGIPCGFVFPDAAGVAFAKPSRKKGRRDMQASEKWSALLSHEVLEMIIDPDVNMLVGGVLPTTKRVVLAAYEVCDPVQASTYANDGVQVANFVTPQYYKNKARRRGVFERTNYLQAQLEPFDVLDGGSYCYFDPAAGRWDVYARNDAAWRTARGPLEDVPRTRRRMARFLRTRDPWSTLTYGCPDYSLPPCGGAGGDGN